MTVLLLLEAVEVVVTFFFLEVAAVAVVVTVEETDRMEAVEGRTVVGLTELDPTTGLFLLSRSDRLISMRNKLERELPWSNDFIHPLFQGLLPSATNFSTHCCNISSIGKCKFVQCHVTDVLRDSMHFSLKGPLETLHHHLAF